MCQYICDYQRRYSNIYRNIGVCIPIDGYLYIDMFIDTTVYLHMMRARHIDINIYTYAYKYKHIRANI